MDGDEAKGTCIRACKETCEWKTFRGGNHINYKIAHDSDEGETRMMSAAQCVNVLESLVFNEGCKAGGDGSSGGFYWKSEFSQSTRSVSRCSLPFTNSATS